MMAEVRHATLPIKLMFEDDGRTGYAYLINASGEIVADVWVYNTVDTPEEDEWKDPTLLPFRNSKRYVKQGQMFDLPRQASDVSVNWSETDDGLVGGSLLIQGIVAARLFEGDTPGMSLMASRDGPLARVLL